LGYRWCCWESLGRTKGHQITMDTYFQISPS